MMYQRDMMDFRSSLGVDGLADEGEQAADDGVEGAVDAEEEDAEQAGHDQHHDHGRHRLPAARRGALAGLGGDLPEEFAGIGSCHLRSSSSRASFGQPPSTGGPVS